LYGFLPSCLPALTCLYITSFPHFSFTELCFFPASRASVVWLKAGGEPRKEGRREGREKGRREGREKGRWEG
jgi:hypothetical protein